MNRGIIAALVVAGLATGCSGPKSKVIPTDPSKWGELQDTAKKLNDDDRKELTAYMMRMTFAGVFGGKQGAIPPGTTIGDAIKSQKDFEAQQSASEAQAAAVRVQVEAQRAQAIAKINQAATVAVTDYEILPKDIEAGRFSSRLNLTIGIQNHTAKQITGVKGDIEFKDQFGTKISTLVTALTQDVAPGATASVSNYGRDLNEFENSDQVLATTPFNRMHVTFVPKMVVFSDGTSIEAPDEPDS